MADLIDNINQRKIGERRSRRAQQDDQHTVCLVDEDSGRIKWIQPSGEQDVMHLHAEPQLSWQYPLPNLLRPLQHMLTAT